MRRRTLDSGQLSTLTHALHMAAERYDESAREMAAGATWWAGMTKPEQDAYLNPEPVEGGGICLRPHGRIYAPLKAQFERQAADVRALADVIAQADELVLETDQ